MTVINEKRRTVAHDKFKKKKLKPLDQRIKGTRASRRKLTIFERTRKTKKQQKKLNCNPRRKYAIQA